MTKTTIKVAVRGLLAAVLVAGSTVAASAETLLMPKRDARTNVPVVVWGVTTQGPVAACILDFGDGSTVACNGADRSYIAFTHTYASQGTFTATLTVGAESATTDVQVFDPTLLPGGAAGENNRNLGINMAIEDGLRYLWVAQSNRAANFPAGATTNWTNGWSSSEAALITLAFQNHGYRLANDGSAPTGVYEKYIVRRGLNYVIASLTTIQISSQASGFAGQPVRDPCVGAGIEASPCTGLRDTRRDTFHESYTTGVAILPLASSGALNRVNTEVAGYTNGKTYGEILQRAVNALAWGQVDSNNASRGGWYYNFNNSSSDGSTVGWDVLAMLDAAAAGAVVPAWVKSEFAYALTGGLNDNGSFDYQANGVAGPQNGITGNYYAVGMEKGGIPLQGMFLIGETSGARVNLVANYLSTRWNSGRLQDDYDWGCNVGGQFNKGCAYSMFNAFKGLKLQGITTLPGVTRPAGPGAIPAGDWYADYQDWLVNNQTSPNATGGGYWGTMQFSCCESGAPLTAAIAELILSPVALVLPDGDKFSTVGLTPPTDTAIEGGTHTVTAHAESTGGSPVAGATVNFTILTGPNAGLTGTGTTDANGNATFTYTDAGPDGTTGTDTIQARIGTLLSNIVEMNWTPNNRPPVAVDDIYSTDEDTQLTVPAAGVLVNDADPDGDTMNVALMSGTTSGVLALAADGSFTYMPNANFNGTDSFTYKVNDGTVDGNIATVTIVVRSVNDLPVCTAAAPSIANIWPPNHQLVNVTVGGVVDPVEGSGITINVTGIFQDEPTNTQGDGNTPVDGYGVGTSTAQVRAERSGTPRTPGNGRVYHINFTGTDADGGTCTGTVTVGVPHDQGQRRIPVDNGPLFSSTGS